MACSVSACWLVSLSSSSDMMDLENRIHSTQLWMLGYDLDTEVLLRTKSRVEVREDYYKIWIAFCYMTNIILLVWRSIAERMILFQLALSSTFFRAVKIPKLRGRGLSLSWRPMLSVVCLSDVSSGAVSWQGALVMCRTVGPVSRHDQTGRGDACQQLSSSMLLSAWVMGQVSEA